jgi:hypothetical protein
LRYFYHKKVAFGFDFLPPYAPERNPDELAWALLKAQIAKGIAKPKNKLKLTVESASHRLQNLPDITSLYALGDVPINVEKGGAALLALSR